MRIHILCVLSPVFLVMLLKHNERELQRNSSFPIIKHKNSFNRAKLFFFSLSTISNVRWQIYFLSL